MKKIAFLILVFFQSFNSLSQDLTVDWGTKSSGYDGSIVIDSNNDIITISKTSGYYSNKYLIEKLDSNGVILWTKALNNTSSQEIKTDSFQNIYIYGTFSETVDFDSSSNEFIINPEKKDLFLLKLDREGDIIWVKIFSSNNDDEKGSFYITNNHIYLTGRGNNIDVNPSDKSEVIVSHNFLVKLNLDGHYITTKFIGYQSGQEQITSIVVDTNENFYISSYRSYHRPCRESDYTHLCEGGTYLESSVNIFLKKYNFMGNLIWTRNIGGDYDDYTRSRGLVLTNNEEIILTGDFSSKVAFKIGDNEHIINAPFRSNFTSKIDKDGNILWVYADNDFDAGYAYSVVEDKDDNIYTIGDYTNSGFFIRKNDTDGNLIWNHLSGSGYQYETGPRTGPNWTKGNDIILDGEQNIIYSCNAISEDDLDPSSASYSLNSFGSFIVKLKKNNSLSIEKNNNLSFKVYPNPTAAFLYLETSLENEISSIKIFNINGKLIATHLKPGLSIDLSNYSNGIYFINIKTKQGLSNFKVSKN
jgi:hypothetical protein